MSRRPFPASGAPSRRTQSTAPRSNVTTITVRTTVRGTTTSGSSDLQRIESMNQQLQRINTRIERKLNEYRNEAELSGALLTRANRLTERLEVLKHKLRMCFDLCGEGPPPNLQLVLKQMSAADPEDAPAEFICPITQCIMVDPVRTSDGHAYDRAAIHEWFLSFQAKGQKPTSPLTNLTLDDVSLTPDGDLRRTIQVFLQQYQAEHAGTAGGKDEPSLRQLTSTMAPAAIADNARSTGGAPIWSSSVVPASEPNSRELNMLRVSEIEVPSSSLQLRGRSMPPAPTSGSQIGRGRGRGIGDAGLGRGGAGQLPPRGGARGISQQATPSPPPGAGGSSHAFTFLQPSAPIWSSAVVPASEPNSRELNMLRVSEIEVPSSSLPLRGRPSSLDQPLPEGMTLEGMAPPATYASAMQRELAERLQRRGMAVAATPHDSGNAHHGVGGNEVGGSPQGGGNVHPTTPTAARNLNNRRRGA